MPAQDPRLVVADLRDHLSRHDKTLAFLFGAGTSCSVRVPNPGSTGTPPEMVPLIPALEALTRICCERVTALGKKFSSALDLLRAEFRSPPNIEDILSKVRLKVEASAPKETLIGLSRGELENMETTIRQAIGQVVNVDPKSIPIDSPHDHFAAWIKRATRNIPIEVFTTNYDILIERGMERMRLPIFDGFVGAYEPFFNPDTLERDELQPGRDWVRLWKIHGSVNWHSRARDSDHRIIRAEPSSNGEMILPSYRKYDESRKQPFLAILHRLGRVLDRDDAFLVTSGYSFGDQHINAVIFTVLENCPRTHVVSLQYEDVSESSQIVRYAKDHTNLVVVARNGAAIGGLWKIWDAPDPADPTLPGFLKGIFDVSATPHSAGRVGEMRLGDFAVFTRFLRTMMID